MNNKYKFKTFISSSLPLPATLPKRPLPTRATFDFENGLRPETPGLCVYFNQFGGIASRRTKKMVPVKFNGYVSSTSGKRYAAVTIDGFEFAVNLTDLYFTHEEEARKAKEAA